MDPSDPIWRALADSITQLRDIKCSVKHREQSLKTIVMKAEHAACGRPEAIQGFEQLCL